MHDVPRRHLGGCWIRRLQQLQCWILFQCRFYRLHVLPRGHVFCVRRNGSVFYVSGGHVFGNRLWLMPVVSFGTIQRERWVRRMYDVCCRNVFKCQQRVDVVSDMCGRSVQRGRRKRMHEL